MRHRGGEYFSPRNKPIDCGKKNMIIDLHEENKPAEKRVLFFLIQIKNFRGVGAVPVIYVERIKEFQIRTSVFHTMDQQEIGGGVLIRTYQPEFLGLQLMLAA